MRNDISQIVSPKRLDRSHLDMKKRPMYGISIIMTCPYCGSAVSWNGKKWCCLSCGWKGLKAMRTPQ